MSINLKVKSKNTDISQQCVECDKIKQYYEDKIKTLTEEFAVTHKKKMKELTEEHIMAVFNGRKIK